MLKTKVDIGCTDSNNWAYQIKLILDRSGVFQTCGYHNKPLHI